MRLADLKGVVMSDWRNGRRAGLRNQCLVRVGSSPTSDTMPRLHNEELKCMQEAFISSPFGFGLATKNKNVGKGSFRAQD